MVFLLISAIGTSATLQLNSLKINHPRIGSGLVKIGLVVLEKVSKSFDRQQTNFDLKSLLKPFNQFHNGKKLVHIFFIQ